jgi:hypothetical protein
MQYLHTFRAVCEWLRHGHKCVSVAALMLVREAHKVTQLVHSCIEIAVLANGRNGRVVRANAAHHAPTLLMSTHLRVQAIHQMSVKCIWACRARWQMDKPERRVCLPLGYGSKPQVMGGQRVRQA